MSDNITLTYMSSFRQQDDLELNISADCLENNVLSLWDPRHKSVFDIKQENGRLSFSVTIDNKRTVLSDYLLPPLLRKFSSLQQLEAFLVNHNLIRVKKHGTEFSVELSISCLGGFPWIPILIFFISAGVTWAADRWIIRPYLIEPLKAKINGSEMGSTVKTVACYALEGVDFALMVLLGGAIESGTSKILISSAMAKCAEKTAELIGKEMAKTAIEKETVQKSLSYFRKFTMGAKDFLELAPEALDLATKHSLDATAVQELFGSLFYYFGKSLPRMLTVLPITKVVPPNNNHALQFQNIEDNANANAGLPLMRSNIASGVHQGPRVIPDNTEIIIRVRSEIEFMERQERLEQIKPAYRVYIHWKRSGKAISDEMVQQMKTAAGITSEQANTLLGKFERRNGGEIPDGSDSDSDRLEDMPDLFE